MTLSNLSSLSLAYRSSVARRQPLATGVFSVVKSACSFHPQPPPTSFVAPRHMHYYSKSRHQWDRTLYEWKASNGKQIMSTSQSDMALSIAKRFLQDEGKGSNVVFSPLSIQVSLSLVAAGCSGPTLDQLLSFLKSSSVDQLNQFGSIMTSNVLADASPSGGPKISFANGVWVNQLHSLKPSFKHIVDTHYKATLRQADFQNKAEEVISNMNTWVKEHTKGLITNILPPRSVNSLTELILANALYFKGDWTNKFDVSETKKDKFYRVDGSSIKTQFMTSGKKQYISTYDGFKVLSMPYRQSRYDERKFSMCIFLPDAKDGLSSLIEKVDSESGFIDRHIPQRQVKVGEFKIPKFKISFEVEVSEVLKKLGLVLPFQSGGLLEMVDSLMNEHIYISNIFHKAFIEVNEKGTEAAAATFTRCHYSNGPLMPIVKVINFVADHPFLFAIREDITKTLLFVGQVQDPTL